MKPKQFKRLMMLLIAFLTISINLWGADVVYKTAKFGSAATSGSSNGYTSTFNSVTDGFSVSVANGNTNNTSWALVKFGRNGNASTGSITTNAAIDKAISKVTINISAITASNVNSITLYSGTAANTCTTSEGTFTKSTGNQSVSISSPATNRFYKIVFDCKSGSSNGFLAVTQVQYIYDDAPTGGGDPDPGTGGSGEWTKVTSLSEITTGYKYLIVSNGATKYMMSSSVASNRFSNGAEATISGNTVTNATIAENCQWEIFKSGDYYYIKQDSKYAGGTTTKNQGAMIATQTDLTKWTVTVDGGVFDFVNYGRSQQSSDYNNKYLRSNTTNGWACYTTGTGAKCMLFRQASGDEPVCEDAPVIGSFNLNHFLKPILINYSIRQRSFEDCSSVVSSSQGDGYCPIFYFAIYLANWRDFWRDLCAYTLFCHLSRQLAGFLARFGLFNSSISRTWACTILSQFLFFYQLL